MQGPALGQGNPQCCQRLEEKLTECSSAEKNLEMKNGIWTSNVLLQPRKPIVAWVAPKVWHQVTVPLYSTPIRSHLESCIQHWGPQHQKDTELLELTAMKIIRGMECLSHGEVLRDFSLEKRSLWGLSQYMTENGHGWWLFAVVLGVFVFVSGHISSSLWCLIVEVLGIFC